MFKIVRLLKRNPDQSVEAFQDRWLNGHRAILKGAPGLRRYIQSHPLVQGYRKGELLFDGVEELEFGTSPEREAFVSSPQMERAREQEADLLESSRTVEFPVDVHVIKDGPIPPEAVKNIEFVTRRPGMALEPFRDYWRNVHGPIASRIPTICRYEQFHTSLIAYEKGSPAYEGLAVTWFRSTADIKAGTETPDYAETRADEPAFLPDGHLPIVITREHSIVG
jgi:uncharacterized protein (TIGR02118 family)